MKKIACLASAALLSVPAAAEPSREAAAFGARPFIQDISLSPDGKKVAIVEAFGGRGTYLAIANFDGKEPQGILRASGTPEQLDYCRWTTASRLICGISLQVDSAGTLIGFTRLIAINDDGSGQKQLTRTPDSFRALGILQSGGSVIDWTGNGAGGSVLVTHDYVRESTIGTRLANEKDGRGVDLLDTVSLARKVVEQPRSSAVEYIRR